MASEETPLLRDADERAEVRQHDAIYDRFSTSQKRIIVAVTALTGTFPSAYRTACTERTPVDVLLQCLRQGRSFPSYRRLLLTSIPPERL